MNTELKITTSEDVLSKLKSLLGLKRGLDLADIFKVKANTISSWKMRNSLPYNRLIEVCHKYNIDLNELFFDNYKKIKDDNQFVKVPILYINSHWDYFFKSSYSNLNLPLVHLPKSINLDIIIQLSVDKKSSIDSEIVYAFCKKVNLENLIHQQTYVFLVKEKGFVYATLQENNKEKNKIQLTTTNQKYIDINTSDIIDSFHCMGTYKNIH